LPSSKTGKTTTMCHYNQPTWPACGHVESRIFNQCEGARERGQICGERYWRVVQSTSKTKDCPQCTANNKATNQAKACERMYGLCGVYNQGYLKRKLSESNKAISSKLLKVLSSKGVTNADSPDRSSRWKNDRQVIKGSRAISKETTQSLSGKPK
jgi:hypothetical protein